MSATYHVVIGSIRHVKPLGAVMRQNICLSLTTAGMTPRDALRHALVASRYCRTALRDGVPVAMWGATSPLLCDKAMVWIVLRAGAARIATAVVRRARRELAEMQDAIGDLYAVIETDDDRSLAFARHIGFNEVERHSGGIVMRYEGKE